MKILIAFVVLCIALVIFHEQWLMFLGNFLIVNDTPDHADVIHIIAGEDYRTDHAIRLYEQGFGETLFFTGGWCEIHLYQHGEHAKERSLAQGVPFDAIAFDDSKVTSTYMEAERLKDWIANNSYRVRAIMVVSDPFHMRRTRWTYRRVFGEEIELYMAPVPFELTPYQHTWWKDPESRRQVFEEYGKFIYYLFRYQYSWGVFKDWLTSLDVD